MEILKINLGNIILLDAELNGLAQPTEQNTSETIIKGFINEVLPLSVKYWLLELNKEVQTIKELINKLREELIKKYGSISEDGSVFIPLYKKGSEVYDESGNIISRELSDEYIKFQEEYSTLLTEEKEIKFKPIPFTVLDKIETDKSYSFILQNLVETNTIK